MTSLEADFVRWMSPLLSQLQRVWSSIPPYGQKFIETIPRHTSHVMLYLIDTAFSPRELMKQITLIIALQSTILLAGVAVRGGQHLLQSFTKLGRQRREIERAMRREVQTYNDWLSLANQLDSLQPGVKEWIAAPESALYDYKALMKRVKDIESMVHDKDIFNLIFRMRGGLARDQFGLLQEGLFSRAMQGTKAHIEKYTGTVCAALNFIADHHAESEVEEEVPIEVKLAFFNETRHAYGRTALLLSGGAALGYYHIGLARTLLQEGLLPRVISGASAGSLMAAMIGSRTDSDLLTFIETASFRKDFFAFEYKVKNSVSARFQYLLPQFLRPLSDALLHVLFSQKSLLRLDTNHLREVVIELVGTCTFQEAFDKTGRIINITVAPLNNFDPPRLLNYLTAPHVCVWSAAVASCAIPGVFESISLVVKEPDGQFREEHEWVVAAPTSSMSSSASSSSKYSDGSIENDLPMQQLSELFNVNHFIVSQVNPHSFLLSSLSLQSSTWNSGPLRVAMGYLRFLKAQSRQWLRNILELVMYRTVERAGRRGFTQILTQEYEGRENDISIMPWKLPVGINIVRAFLSLIKNLTDEEFRETVRVSARNTFPHIARIRAHCAIEVTLDKCVQRLRRRIADNESQILESGGNRAMLDRTPSFFSVRSMVNLSGLGVTDPLIRLASHDSGSGDFLAGTVGRERRGSGSKHRQQQWEEARKGAYATYYAGRSRL